MVSHCWMVSPWLLCSYASQHLARWRMEKKLMILGCGVATQMITRYLNHLGCHILFSRPGLSWDSLQGLGFQKSQKSKVDSYYQTFHWSKIFFLNYLDIWNHPLLHGRNQLSEHLVQVSVVGRDIIFTMVVTSW